MICVGTDKALNTVYYWTASDGFGGGKDSGTCSTGTIVLWSSSANGDIGMVGETTATFSADAKSFIHWGCDNASTSYLCACVKQ